MPTNVNKTLVLSGLHKQRALGTSLQAQMLSVAREDVVRQFHVSDKSAYGQAVISRQPARTGLGTRPSAVRTRFRSHQLVLALQKNYKLVPLSIYDGKKTVRTRNNGVNYASGVFMTQSNRTKVQSRPPPVSYSLSFCPPLLLWFSASRFTRG